VAGPPLPGEFRKTFFTNTEPTFGVPHDDDDDDNDEDHIIMIATITIITLLDTSFYY
jgi:hypothetical protein